MNERVPRNDSALSIEAQRLLRTARVDAPPPAMVERALVRGGFRTAGLAWSTKVLAVIGGLTLVAALRFAPQAVREAAPLPSAAPLATLTALPPETSMPHASFSVATESPRLAVPQTPPPRSSAPTARRVEGDLAREASMLHRARTDLLSGNLDGAREQLRAYGAWIGPKQLQAEGDVLAIELERRSGNSTRAASLASAFLRKHPEGPLSERVRDSLRP